MSISNHTIAMSPPTPTLKKMDEKFIASCRELPGCNCIDTTFMALGAIEGNRTHLFDSVYKFIGSTRSRL